MRRYATVLALGLGVALTLYPIVRVSAVNGVTAIGGAGLACLVIALTWARARSLAVGAVILIALHYALALHADAAGLDVYAVLVGAGLFALYEATDLSISVADVAPMTRPALTYRATAALATAATGALLAVVAILARSLFSAGITGVIIGAICALGIVALAVWLPYASSSASKVNG